MSSWIINNKNILNTKDIFSERVSGIEPPFSDWQPDVITTIRHPPSLIILNFKLIWVPGERIELSTQRFSVFCSTTELPRL